MSRRYLEDLEVGTTLTGQSYDVDEAEMLDFSRKWDPRDIHLDEAAAREAGHGGIIASGAYTTAIFTLLSVRTRNADGDHAVIAGLGSETRLAKPVRAGDSLRYESTIVEVRESQSRPDAGIVKSEARLVNQRDETVYSLVTAVMVARRPA